MFSTPLVQTSIPSRKNFADLVFRTTRIATENRITRRLIEACDGVDWYGTRIAGTWDIIAGRSGTMIMDVTITHPAHRWGALGLLITQNGEPANLLLTRVWSTAKSPRVTRVSW